MSNQHFSATIYIGDYAVTGQVSDLEYKLVELSDDEQALHYTSSIKTSEILDREESELQALDAEFVDDDLETDQRIEKMNKEQDIQNKYQREVDKELSRTQVKEKELEKQQTMTETQLEAARATKETYDEYLDQTDMGYLNNN